MRIHLGRKHGVAVVSEVGWVGASNLSHSGPKAFTLGPVCASFQMEV